MIDTRENALWTVYIHIIPKAITQYDYDKYYVGITSKTVNDRWNKGFGYRNQFFYKAIQKYGWENIEHYIIAENLTQEEAKSFEILLIKELNSNNNKYGYNITAGGDNVSDSIRKNKLNPIGQKYGRITVVEEVLNDKEYYCRLVNGICDCGNKVYKINLESLVNGSSQSCGCYGTEQRRKAHKKYNNYDLSKEYGIGWTSNTNEEFYFDLEDYDKIKNYCWSLDKRTNRLVTATRNRRKNTRVNLGFSNVIYGFGKQSKKKLKINFFNDNVLDYRKSNMSIQIPEGLNYDDYFYFLTQYNEYIQWSKYHNKWQVVHKHLSPSSKYFDDLDAAIKYRNQIYNINQEDQETDSFLIKEVV